MPPVVSYIHVNPSKITAALNYTLRTNGLIGVVAASKEVVEHHVRLQQALTGDSEKPKIVSRCHHRVSSP